MNEKSNKKRAKVWKFAEELNNIEVTFKSYFNTTEEGKLFVTNWTQIQANVSHNAIIMLYTKYTSRHAGLNLASTGPR